MSEELSKTQIVNDFLKEVKNRLPGWLKDNKKELKEVLSELESHLWEKSEEIANGMEIQVHHVQQAVNEMGSPRNIAAEYKKRGTPKIWISKELFPSFLKVLGIIVSIIVVLNTVSFIVNSVTGTLSWDLFASFLNGIWTSALGALLFVSIIFVALSMEGYLPEDFKKSRRKYQLKPIPSDKADKLEELDRKWQKKRPKHVKPPLKRGELLVGGIILILIGLAMYAEIWVYFPYVEDIGVKLTDFLKLAGIFTMVGGFINLIQSMIGMTNYFAQRLLIGIHTAIDIAFIPILVILFVPAVMAVPAINGILITDYQLYNSIELGFTVIQWISVVGTIIGAVSNISKIITLRMKFEEYLQFHEM